MTRSLTDEQLAARWDPEPYLDGDGNRVDREMAAELADNFIMLDLDPRVECIPSRDPYPWRIEVINRADHEHVAARDGERLADPSWVTFWDRATERLVFDPQPEFARPPINPILVAFREHRADGGHPSMVDTALDWLDYTRTAPRFEGPSFKAYWAARMVATPEQIDLARKVLTRLVALDILTFEGTRLGRIGWINLSARPGRSHAHEVAEGMRKLGETYTLVPVDADLNPIPVNAGSKPSRFRVDYTGQALSLVPTRLLKRAEKILNRPGDTHGDIRDVLREIVGAADTNTTKGI